MTSKVSSRGTAGGAVEEEVEGVGRLPRPIRVNVAEAGGGDSAVRAPCARHGVMAIVEPC